MKQMLLQARADKQMICRKRTAYLNAQWWSRTCRILVQCGAPHSWTGLWPGFQRTQFVRWPFDPNCSISLLVTHGKKNIWLDVKSYLVTLGKLDLEKIKAWLSTLCKSNTALCLNRHWKPKHVNFHHFTTFALNLLLMNLGRFVYWEKMVNNVFFFKSYNCKHLLHQSKPPMNADPGAACHPQPCKLVPWQG